MEVEVTQELCCHQSSMIISDSLTLHELRIFRMGYSI